MHLDRFVGFFIASYGHDRITTCLKRDVVAWQRALVDGGLAPATVNNSLASLSAFTTWVAAQAPSVFPVGDPAKGVGELGLPALEPRALTPGQVRSLKNVCDRLERFHQKKGDRWTGNGPAPLKKQSRPLRDRAIVSVLLST
ncbi:MAG: site-specific recombinase, partial [Chloroflexota bacterium]|nr:site-specific recombinase [Chloroflexota bacterium]